MTLSELFGTPLWRSWAESLVHFVWQGALLGVAASVAVRFMRKKGAQVRYAIDLGALLLMAACLPVTFAVVYHPPAGAVPTSRAADSPRAPSAATLTQAAAAPSLDELEAYYPWVLAAWWAGVSIFGMRLAASWIGLRLLVRRREPLPDALSNTIARLVRQLGLRRAPGVFRSARITDAAAIGFFRPIVLVPAAWLLELSPEALEAVLAHELAHIRRHDLWVNLFQRVVETMLFYHPAVWWVSRRLRAEREICCDELAVSVTHQPLVYVTALESVARRRAGLVKPAVAVTLGDQHMALLTRIQHILGRAPASPVAGWWPAAVLALALPVGLWIGGGLITPPPATADESAVNDDDRRVDRDDDDDDDDDRARPEGRREVRVIERVHEGGDDEDDPEEAVEGEVVERRITQRGAGGPPEEWRTWERRERRDGRRPDDEPRDPNWGPPPEGGRPVRAPEGRAGGGVGVRRIREAEERGWKRERRGDDDRGGVEELRREWVGPDGQRREWVEIRRRDTGRREWDADQRDRGPRDQGPREGDRRGGPQDEMIQMLRELRHEVDQLRREVRELRAQRGPDGPRMGGGGFGPGPVRDGDRGPVREERRVMEQGRPRPAGRPDDVRRIDGPPRDDGRGPGPERRRRRDEGPPREAPPAGPPEGGRPDRQPPGPPERPLPPRADGPRPEGPRPPQPPGAAEAPSLPPGAAAGPIAPPAAPGTPAAEPSALPPRED